MKFGLEKCAKATFNGGKLVKTENIELDVGTTIQDLEQEGTYKYLGVNEGDGPPTCKDERENSERVSP